jgi:GTP-binding protein
MKILSAEFITSCTEPGQFPQEPLPEVAFVGRSNVGKSSLINSLLGRKSLAKVSGTPGKTRLVNFFLVTTTDPALKRFYVVDLPGYGYAKAAKSLRAQWGPMIEQYFAERASLCGVLLLVDARRTEGQDETAYVWLRELGRPPVVVATKIDKFTRGARQGQLAAIRTALGLPEAVPLVPYSSESHEGRDELWQLIRKQVETMGRDPS